jgi:putative transposase
VIVRPSTTENPFWGEERITNELLVKLGIRVSPRTVRKYMRRRYQAGRAAISAGRRS